MDARIPAARRLEKPRSTRFAELAHKALHDCVEVTQENRMAALGRDMARRDLIDHDPACCGVVMGDIAQIMAVIGMFALIERRPVTPRHFRDQAIDHDPRRGDHREIGDLADRCRLPDARPARGLRPRGVWIGMGRPVHQAAIAEEIGIIACGHVGFDDESAADAQGLLRAFASLIF